MQQRFPSIFKLPVNRRFEYNPVYHDPAKEEMMELSGKNPRKEYRKQWSAGRKKNKAAFSLSFGRLVAIAVSIWLLALVFLK